MFTACSREIDPRKHIEMYRWQMKMEGYRRIATDLLLSGVCDGVGELVERVAHLRGGDIGGCVLESLQSRC